MIIYLDTCCYGRPSDDQTQYRIAAETAAIIAIIDMCHIAGHSIIGSMAVTSEIEDNRDVIKRNDTMDFFNRTLSAYVTANDDVRAQALQAAGVRKMDSYHLAFAEIAGADVLLTTDDPFVRVCEKKNLSFVKVINPLTFLPEIMK